MNDQQDEQIVRSYSDGSYGARTLSDPDVHKLHQLSLDGKPLPIFRFKRFMYVFVSRIVGRKSHIRQFRECYIFVGMNNIVPM